MSFAKRNISVDDFFVYNNTKYRKVKSLRNGDLCWQCVSKNCKASIKTDETKALIKIDCSKHKKFCAQVSSNPSNTSFQSIAHNINNSFVSVFPNDSQQYAEDVQRKLEFLEFQKVSLMDKVIELKNELERVYFDNTHLKIQLFSIQSKQKNQATQTNMKNWPNLEDNESNLKKKHSDGNQATQTDRISWHSSNVNNICDSRNICTKRDQASQAVKETILHRSKENNMTTNSNQKSNYKTNMLSITGGTSNLTVGLTKERPLPAQTKSKSSNNYCSPIKNSQSKTVSHESRSLNCNRVLVASDSHGKYIGDEIEKNLTIKDSNVFVNSCSGAPLSYILNNAKDMTMTYAENDVCVIVGGNNDFDDHLSQNSKQKIPQKIKSFINSNLHTNYIVINLFHRYDLTWNSTTNRNINIVNRELRNLKKNGIIVLDVSFFKRNLFTRHGQHLNSRGKEKLAKMIAQNVEKTVKSNKVSKIDITSLKDFPPLMEKSNDAGDNIGHSHQTTVLAQSQRTSAAPRRCSLPDLHSMKNQPFFP